MTRRLAEFARLEAATRTLLSPLAFPDAQAWAGAAAEAVRSLVEADSAMVILPGPRFIEGPGMPRTVRAAYDHLYEGALKGEATDDPLALEFVRRRHEEAVDAVDFDSVNRLLGGRIDRSQFHQNAFVAGGIRDMHALYADTVVAGRPAEVALVGFFERPLVRGRGDAGLAALRALKPAFLAGLEMLTRMDAERALLEAVSEPLAVFDVDGREVHRNDALLRLLDADPERHQVDGTLCMLACSLRPLVSGRHAGAPPMPTRCVRTVRGRYVLTATVLPGGIFGSDGAVLVSVGLCGAGPMMPSVDDVQHRHHLSRREAEVALLLAERKTSTEIAAALFISAHTARHHAEHVLSKLGVRSRNDVAGAIAADD